MAAPTKVIIDQWSKLSHKGPVGQPNDQVNLTLAPTWVPASERRRLAAYIVRAAYLENVARLLLPHTVTDDDRNKHREYGDPSAFIDRLVGAVLGDGWAITVDGADEDLLDGPNLPPQPPGPADGASELEQRIATAKLAAWEALAVAEVDAWEAALAEQPMLQRRQDELRAWADAVQLAARLHEGEQTTAGLGDGVYVLWPRAGDWPLVEVHDPGVYFPQLTDHDRGEFPHTVHLAWEFEQVIDGVVQVFVRRLTWQLVDLTMERVTFDASGALVWTDASGAPLADGTIPTDLPANDTISPDGIVERTLPWHQPETPPARITCVFSNGVWPLDAVQEGKVDALDADKATWDAWRVDLGVDFIPVVHVPNTPAGDSHYGDGALDAVAQLVDDMAQNDTRIMNGSAFLGLPMIGVSGANVSDVVVQPGQAVGLPEGGRMDTLDLSAGIEKLMALGNRLDDRFFQNVGAPREVMGKASTDTASGVHLALKYAPWAQVVTTLRIPRGPKMALLLKFAQRLAQVARHEGGEPVLEPGPTPVARLTYGGFLPFNKAETATMVASALQAHAISLQTAVALLVAAGFPIDDAQAEIERIKAEHPEAAKAIAEALPGIPAGEQAAADWLGIDLPDAGAAPSVQLPPPAGA